MFAAKEVSALGFVVEEHFLAVLPIYLHLLIVLEPSSNVPRWLLPELTRPDPDDVLYERKLAVFDRVRLMTDEQKSAVVATLRLFIAKWPHQSEAARVALARYWDAF